MFQGAIDWLDRIGPRVYTAFVEGDRWKLYLKGLGLTLEMTVVALCFGLVLGLIVAVIRTAHDQQRVDRPEKSPAGAFKWDLSDLHHRHPGHPHAGPAVHLDLRHLPLGPE